MGNGKYELYLERGYNYQVWFFRSDMVTKHVHIDAREIPLYPDVPFYDMDLPDDPFRLGGWHGLRAVQCADRAVPIQA